MISIITAIHNQLEMNEIFWENLKKYTHYPFELIIIDNHSSDGSKEFFIEKGVTVIANQANYSYPYTQNQGIKIASNDIFAFLNNDIIVSPNWDQKILDSMEKNQLDVITVCGIERVESLGKTLSLGRRWKLIKNLTGFIPKTKKLLTAMHYLMYGNCVIFNRKALDLLGLWDERIQGADWDLYIRSKKRALEFADIKPCHIALDVFNHHYIRLTQKAKPPVFADAASIIKLEEKWSKEELALYLKDNLST